jgi:hypothetical protein
MLFMIEKAENAAVGFDVLTTCQPSTVWCSRERLPAAAAQPAQGSSEPVAPQIYFYFTCVYNRSDWPQNLH